MYDPDLHSIKWTGKHVFVLFCVVLNNFITFFSLQETDRLKESISDKGISIT